MSDTDTEPRPPNRSRHRQSLRQRRRRSEPKLSQKSTSIFGCCVSARTSPDVEFWNDVVFITPQGTPKLNARASSRSTVLLESLVPAAGAGQVEQPACSTRPQSIVESKPSTPVAVCETTVSMAESDERVTAVTRSETPDANCDCYAVGAERKNSVALRHIAGETGNNSWPCDQEEKNEKNVRPGSSSKQMSAEAKTNAQTKSNERVSGSVKKSAETQTDLDCVSGDLARSFLESTKSQPITIPTMLGQVVLHSPPIMSVGAVPHCESSHLTTLSRHNFPTSLEPVPAVMCMNLPLSTLQFNSVTSSTASSGVLHLHSTQSTSPVVSSTACCATDKNAVSSHPLTNRSHQSSVTTATATRNVATGTSTPKYSSVQCDRKHARKLSSDINMSNYATGTSNCSSLANGSATVATSQTPPLCRTHPYSPTALTNNDVSTPEAKNKLDNVSKPDCAASTNNNDVKQTSMSDRKQDEYQLQPAHGGKQSETTTVNDGEHGTELSSYVDASNCTSDKQSNELPELTQMCIVEAETVTITLSVEPSQEPTALPVESTQTDINAHLLDIIQIDRMPISTETDALQNKPCVQNLKLMKRQSQPNTPRLLRRMQPANVKRQTIKGEPRRRLTKSIESLEDVVLDWDIAYEYVRRKNYRKSFIGDVTPCKPLDKQTVYNDHSFSDVQTLLKHSKKENIYALLQPASFSQDTIQAVKRITDKYNTPQRWRMQAKSFESSLHRASVVTTTAASDHPAVITPTPPSVTAPYVREKARLGLFYRSYAAEICICDCLADVKQRCGRTEPWVALYTGRPLLVFNTGSGRRRRQLQLVVADPTTALPLWSDYITYLSEFRPIEQSETPCKSRAVQTLRLSSNLRLQVALVYYSRRAATEFYSHFRTITADPSDSLWMVSEDRSSVQKRQHRPKLSDKTVISHPCHFAHVTHIEPMKVPPELGPCMRIRSRSLSREPK